MLKKQHGNMYKFVTHMWGPVRGKCSHDCSYCYMKKWGPQQPIHLDEKDLKTDLGDGRFIFVCHTADLFANDIPIKWIERVLEQLREYPLNKYLLQSKNPMIFLQFLLEYPNNIMFGTTIETNRDIVETKAPSVFERAEALSILNKIGYETMVTIEPIFDFDLNELVELIITANPEWVNIGGDSKGHDLPEPSSEKIAELIKALKEKTDVNLKGNLQRIYSKP